MSAPEHPPEPAEVVPTDVLVERARLGDRVAFGALYDRLAPSLSSAAVRFLREHREADDLVHDVFLEAWQHIREYDARRGSVRTWLLVRLRSRALDFIGRAEARHMRPAQDLDVAMEPSHAPSQHHAMEQKAIHQALQELDADLRCVLEQTYFQGLTAREIAAQSALPLGTVKSRLARGIAALQVALDTEGERDG